MQIWTSGPGEAGAHLSFRTTCGRDIRVGHLVLGGNAHPARRVTLGISASPEAGDGTWAGLTVGEARQLADALLAQAGAAEHDPAPGTRHPGTAGHGNARNS